MKPVLGIKTQEEIKSFRELDAFEYTQYKNAVDWLGTFMTKQDLILIGCSSSDLPFKQQVQVRP